MGATLLKGAPVIAEIKEWCLRRGNQDGVRPVMACVFFNTDDNALEFVRYKAVVARQANVDYWVYELPVDVTSAEARAQVEQLNDDSRIHGILIQRPLPEQLDEVKVMGSIHQHKHIEEFSAGQPSNIAADSLTRFLTTHNYHCKAHDSVLHLAGWGNIITTGFRKQITSHYKRVVCTPDYPLPALHDTVSEKTQLSEKTVYPASEVESTRPVILVSELHRGPGVIVDHMVPPEVKVIIDLGNYVTKDGFLGDVNHKLFKREGLAVAPTPGGILPVLLWMMMERTVKAKLELTKRQSRGCLCQ